MHPKYLLQCYNLKKALYININNTVFCNKQVLQWCYRCYKPRRAGKRSIEKKVPSEKSLWMVYEVMRRNKKSKYKYATINKKRYYFYTISGSTFAETQGMPQKKSSINLNLLIWLVTPMCISEQINICTPFRVMTKKKRSSQTGTSSPSDALLN